MDLEQLFEEMHIPAVTLSPEKAALFESAGDRWLYELELPMINPERCYVLKEQRDGLMVLERSGTVTRCYLCRWPAGAEEEEHRAVLEELASDPETYLREKAVPILLRGVDPGEVVYSLDAHWHTETERPLIDADELLVVKVRRDGGLYEAARDGEKRWYLCRCPVGEWQSVRRALQTEEDLRGLRWRRVPCEWISLFGTKIAPDAFEEYRLAPAPGDSETPEIRERRRAEKREYDLQRRDTIVEDTMERRREAERRREQAYIDRLCGYVPGGDLPELDEDETDLPF